MRLKPDPHAPQWTVIQSHARFKVLSSGRRWGKTLLATIECAGTAAAGKRAWWVAPTFPIASIGWREIRSLAVRIPGVEIREGERMAVFPNGGWVQVKSAHDPDSLRGEGLDFVAFDECAFAQERAWTEGLRPALSDRQGKALFISTPKGRNWFWRLWLQGQGHDPDWQSWQFPTASNPYIDKAEIESARRTLPQKVFQQEYEAAFLEDAGSVFRNVMACATAQERTKGGRVVLGVDWGKHEDWTVITALDAATGEMMGLHRYNQIDYTFQTDRLKAWAQRYKAQTVMCEANAMGEPLIDQLRRDGLPVQPFVTSAQSKAEIINALALAFDQQEIKVLADPVLVNELQAFEMKQLPGGGWRYAAPEGLHDDCVMSLALAWHAAKGQHRPSLFFA